MKKRDNTPYANKAEVIATPTPVGVVVIKAYDGIEVGTRISVYTEKLRVYMFEKGYWGYAY